MLLNIKWNVWNTDYGIGLKKNQVRNEHNQGFAP